MCDKTYHYRVCKHDSDKWEVYSLYRLNKEEEPEEDWAADVGTETIAKKLVEAMSTPGQDQNIIMPLILEQLAAERHRQIGKQFDANWDDNNKSFDDWCQDIQAYVVWARQMARMRSPEKYRRRMLQIAALAIAACESYDRKNEIAPA